ncbi:MAG: hypothetical protein ACI8PD_002267 [Nitrospinales bacterium]|jgi:hypothetical protein
MSNYRLQTRLSQKMKHPIPLNDHKILKPQTKQTKEKPKKQAEQKISAYPLPSHKIKANPINSIF